jgi:hypothetical protein
MISVGRMLLMLTVHGRMVVAVVPWRALNALRARIAMSFQVMLIVWRAFEQAS